MVIKIIILLIILRLTNLLDPRYHSVLVHTYVRVFVCAFIRNFEVYVYFVLRL